MTTRGRKPTPSQIQLLMGNPGDRPVNKKESKPKPVLPSPPSALKGEALREWKRVAKELGPLRVISKLDRSALAAYCISWARLTAATKALNRAVDGPGAGLLIETSNGNLIQNPLLGVQRRAAVAVPVSFWALEPGEVTIALSGADGAEAADPLTMVARPGLNAALITEVVVSSLAPGDYSVEVHGVDGQSEPVLSLNVRPAAEPPPQEAPDEPDEMTVEVEVRETRLDPTDLPWERFDRPEVLLPPPPRSEGERLGDWVWSEDPGTGWQTHERGQGPAPIHYALFAEPKELIRGENIVQYFWIDPLDTPAQIVLQVYDEVLDARHRVSFGADALTIDGRDGFGHIQSGALPAAGIWLRLRLPVSDIGMDGRGMRGIGYLSDGGRVLWGPTRLSGVDDASPMLSRIEDRDRTGAPQSDFIIRISDLSPGDLTVSLALREGGEIEIFDGPVTESPRQFWWNGDAALLRGAQVIASNRPAGEGAVSETTSPVPGNPALVARILYPPHGAVVRQTVPVFGQAGGAGFDHFVVEYRAAGTGEGGWTELARSRTPSLVTDAGIRDRINQIMASELRGTVYGNLASLDTGSALHSFEFSEAAPTLPSGWIEIRLTTRDADGNARQDFTNVIVGEVATGQARSDIASLDGRSVLSVPPLSLPAGMGAVSLAATEKRLPADAPAPASRIYSFAPAGLQLNAPLQLAIEAPEAKTIVSVDEAGRVTPLPTDSADGIVRASLRGSGPRAVYYATTAEFPRANLQARRDEAPWFDVGDDSALIASLNAPDGARVSLPDPVPLNEPLGIVLSLTPHRAGSAGIVLRFDGDAVFVPLNTPPSGLAGSLAADGLGIADSPDPIAVFLPLSAYIPATAKRLESVKLMSIDAAAWRTYIGRPVRKDEVDLHTLAIGRLPLPGPVLAWISAWPWTSAGGTDAQPSQPVSFEGDGFHWVMVGGGAKPWPVLIDRTAPSIEELHPAESEDSGDLVVTAKLTDLGSGIAADTIDLTINGVKVPGHLVAFNHQTGVLEASIGDIQEARISNGGLVSARLSVSDRLGQTGEPVEWQWRHRSTAIAVGNLTQLTVDGGTAPAWEPGGGSYIYVGFQDGQNDLFRSKATGGAHERLTNNPDAENSPAVSPEGRIAYLVDGRLKLVDGDAPEVGELSGLAWQDETTLLAGQRNRILRIGLDGMIEEVCEIAVGAEASDPKPVAGDVLFVQQLYHRTVWLCDSASGTARPLSEGINLASTRDVDASAINDDRFIYARNDGRSGLWQRRIEDPRSTQVLTGAGGSDRRPAIAPDGLSLLFDTDRSGRREIWRLDFAEAPQFKIATPVATGRADEGISILIDEIGDDRALSVSGPDGELIDATPRVTESDEGIVLLASSDWPEGELQVTLILAGGTTVSAPILVDRTPPEIAISRISDGLSLEDIVDVGPLDSFSVEIADVSNVTVVSASDDTIATGAVFSTADLDSPIIEIEARDAAGNLSKLTANLALGSASESRVGPRPDPAAVNVDEATDDDDEQPWPGAAWFLVWIILAAAATGAIVLQFRRRQV